MDFSTIPNEYLDMTEKKIVKDVYQRRVFVYRNFIKPIDGIPIDQNTPRHIHEYLKTLKSNSFYNEHRQELSALFNQTKRYLPHNYHSLSIPASELKPCPMLRQRKRFLRRRKI
jgi:hypothetical protein